VAGHAPDALDIDRVVHSLDDISPDRTRRRLAKAGGQATARQRLAHSIDPVAVLDMTAGLVILTNRIVE
jgi:hypothetical protein